MLVRYATRYPQRLAGALARDPVGVWDTVQDRVAQSREQRRPPWIYKADPDWEAKLHAAIGAPWPCDDTQAFRALWPRVVADVTAHGVRVGPASFNGFNDGDAALVRAIWCLVCHLSPSQIVETGVAHGFTSRFILEALEQNGAGHLSSIDLPPLDSTMQRQIGMAVEPHLRPRWSLTLGSSRRCLATLLEALGAIDIFVHDSLHSERNVRFELDLAWRYLRPGGALVVDDVDSNWGFKSFLDAHPLGRAIVAEAEPVRPDFRRFNNKGLFGIVLKPNVQATVR